MGSVTKRIKEISQPRGGYLNPKLLEVIPLADKIALKENENIHASIVGTAVDYLTRAFICETPIDDAFAISLRGASLIGEEPRAKKLLKKIHGLTPSAIEAACKLVRYDVCFRRGPEFYKDINYISPNEDTIENILSMLHRSELFFEAYGPVLLDGFTFPGGYTDTVDSGDGDFLTMDTIWDYKVSVRPPTNEHTLQLLMYYIMGLHSEHKCFKNIKYIGIFNPRLNTVYRYELAKVDPTIFKAIEQDVICY